MPARHISPQSFDDILSELGDDPAIPDPHGIRKSSAPPRSLPESQIKANPMSFSMPELRLNSLKTNPVYLLGTLLIVGFTGLFLLLESKKVSSDIEFNVLQSQISELKNELAFAQSERLSEQEDLYDAIGELEVSIHSLNEKPPTVVPLSKPVAIPYEAELRRWRYLGLTRMGGLEQAFFHTGKAILMLPKDGVALGEWRLTQAEKEGAILTHTKGKLITFKPTKSE